MKLTTRFATLFLVLSAFWLTSCGPTMKITSSWMNHDVMGTGKYQKVFLLAMTQNDNAKRTVEAAQAAAAKGLVETVMSSEAFPPAFLKNNPGQEAVIKKIRELGCDAVFTSALIKSKSETRYVPGSVTYMPYPRYGYYGTFGGYYGYYGGMMYDPGYYTNTETYFIESNLYDLESGEIVWSVQSEVYNPGSLASVSKSYAAMLIDRLKQEGGLYRKK